MFHKIKGFYKSYLIINHLEMKQIKLVLLASLMIMVWSCGGGSEEESDSNDSALGMVISFGVLIFWIALPTFGIRRLASRKDF